LLTKFLVVFTGTSRPRRGRTSNVDHEFDRRPKLIFFH